MEYIQGDIPSPEHYPILATRLLPILEQFETIQNCIPGPLGGGPSRGMFWEDDYPCFPSTTALEDWINQRIFGEKPKVSFRRTPLVLCHMDLTPRNMIELSDGSLCILDWASAGFYPHVFEVAMLQLKPYCNNEDKFIEPLLRYGILKQEPTQLAQVIKAWGNSQRFHIKPTAISNRPQPIIDIPRRRNIRDRSWCSTTMIEVSGTCSESAVIEEVGGEST